MLRTPDPVLVVHLFPRERAELLALLESLPVDDWSKPTIAGNWTVKDVAAHLVADDFGRLSSRRDGHREQDDESAGETITGSIDRRNAVWVAAMRRLSPRVIRSLLELGGRDTQSLFESVDPIALGSPVSWAGAEPAPNWLDLAREFTERWHHHQQIREAVGAPLLDDPRFLGPVLATFAFALVPAYRDVRPPPGTTVHLKVEGASGGDWTLAHVQGQWGLRVGRPDSTDASITMSEDTAWRMYVGALPHEEVEARSALEGEPWLAGPLLRAFALLS